MGIDGLLVVQGEIGEVKVFAEDSIVSASVGAQVPFMGLSFTELGN